MQTNQDFAQQQMTRFSINQSHLKASALLCFCAILGACSSANHRYQQLDAHLANSIDCEHAHMQISDLEQNKLSSSEKFANSVATVLPSSIVINLIAGEYSARAKLASGQFDDKVQMRIDDIKQTCMISEKQPTQKTAT